MKAALRSRYGQKDAWLNPVASAPPAPGEFSPYPAPPLGEEVAEFLGEQAGENPAPPEEQRSAYNMPSPEAIKVATRLAQAVQAGQLGGLQASGVETGKTPRQLTAGLEAAFRPRDGGAPVGPGGPVAPGPQAGPNPLDVEAARFAAKRQASNAPMQPNDAPLSAMPREPESPVGSWHGPKTGASPEAVAAVTNLANEAMGRRAPRSAEGARDPIDLNQVENRDKLIEAARANRQLPIDQQVSMPITRGKAPSRYSGVTDEAAAAVGEPTEAGLERIADSKDRKAKAKQLLLRQSVRSADARSDRMGNSSLPAWQLDGGEGMRGIMAKQGENEAAAIKGRLGEGDKERAHDLEKLRIQQGLQDRDELSKLETAVAAAEEAAMLAGQQDPYSPETAQLRERAKTLRQQVAGRRAAINSGLPGPNGPQAPGPQAPGPEGPPPPPPVGEPAPGPIPGVSGPITGAAQAAVKPIPQDIAMALNAAREAAGGDMGKFMKTLGADFVHANRDFISQYVAHPSNFKLGGIPALNKAANDEAFWRSAWIMNPMSLLLPTPNLKSWALGPENSTGMLDALWRNTVGSPRPKLPPR